MPVFQIILNLPFLLAGFGIKYLFFARRGMGREYLAGIKNGFQISKKDRKVHFTWKNLPQYILIQIELWINLLRRLQG